MAALLIFIVMPSVLGSLLPASRATRISVRPESGLRMKSDWKCYTSAGEACYEQQ